MQEHTLIANSGIQIITFPLRINTQEKFKMWYHEWYDTENGEWRLDPVYELRTDDECYYYNKQKLHKGGYLSDPTIEIDVNELKSDDILPLRIEDENCPGVRGDIFSLTFSDKDNKFSKFKTDGLHRLVRDREKMHKVSMQTYGGNVRYATPGLCIGLTALSYSFGNYSIQPDPKPYNLFYFRGNRNLNISVDYLLKNKLIKFYGETALSRNGAVASLNALQLTPASYFSLLLLYRYYDKRYQAFFGNAFSQNSAVRNEQGMYIGMQWTPFARWKLSAYADVFRFPWLKYGVDAPSTGKEYMLQLDYTPSRNLSVYVRYKYKQRENITPYHQQRLRMQALYTISSSVSLRTSADGICYTEANEKSRGWMIAQSVGWKPVDVPVQTDFHIAGFHTDNYRTRISSYEKNILYAFNMPSFYGKGVRLALSFRWDIVKQLSVSAKLGYTYYADRDVVGTDLEEIEGNIKADIYTLLRWKF